MPDFLTCRAWWCPLWAGPQWQIVGHFLASSLMYWLIKVSVSTLALWPILIMSWVFIIWLFLCHFFYLLKSFGFIYIDVSTGYFIHEFSGYAEFFRTDNTEPIYYFSVVIVTAKDVGISRLQLGCRSVSIGLYKNPCIIVAWSGCRDFNKAASFPACSLYQRLSQRTSLSSNSE